MLRKCFLSVLCLGTLALAGCPQPPTTPTSLNPNPRLFKTLYRYATGANTSEVVMDDLNGDRVKDLVTSNRGGASISVLLGDPAGGYKEKVDYTAGDSPATVQLVDLNKDGKLDAVVANAGSDDVSVFIGAGDGTFAAQVRYPLLSASLPADMIAADLNDDTKPDLAVACSGNNTVSILYGLGDGTFNLVPTVIPVGKGPRSIVAADLDKNGVLDLVTANRDDNALGILFGQADFSYGPPIKLDVGTTPRTVRAADLDKDGWLDLVASNPGSADMSILLGGGDGEFVAESRVELPYLPTRFVLQDFNNDGDQDLAIVLYNATDGAPLGLVDVLAGDGEGGFDDHGRLFGIGAGALDIQAVKVDSDSAYDLVATGGATANIVFGTGKLAFETEERFATGTLPRAVAVADFDEDDNKDLLVTNLQSNSVTLLLGDGKGGFAPGESINTPGIPRAIAAGRIDGDGHQDFVVTDLLGNRVAVFLGLGDGTFQDARLVPIRVASEQRNSEPRSVALADMNGDGKADIVTGNAGTDSVAIVLGKGDGTFQTVQEYLAFNYPLDVTARDMNGDGKLDVVVCNGTEPDSQTATAPRVNVILGKGDGTLDPASRLSYTTGDGPRGMVVGDFNADGFPDAVTVHQGSRQVNVLAGRTGGKLTAGTSVRVGIDPVTVTAGDLNRDGKPDLLTTNASNTLSMLLNNGAGGFSVWVDFPIGATPIGAVLADLNKDNRLDVIVSDTATNQISILLGAPL